ncbi:hypothetical protein VCR4J5_1600020 [Vibrio crassostreae]|uniref:Uncharacterized protein n=1 Tax=Vibrio crassostreae TaxID=246167 RepID=A0ABM9QR47_9VIBR|nr:hypothetical protein VCRA2111O320_170091 [Vibrio crassostreae]CAK1825157.1 hypothetical protein VCRA2113O324_180091 [Vibrio crassostreae]CAK2150447.1 hypothetical protein VCRA2115O371_50217 [Vibrio crassostreae]CAK2373542.1 hypothetical protein VCRA2113O355_50217 [Vibrio crassostreae]CAK2681053.1 hypothetical protein VCRA2121O336_170091 [Vibrio crassostreae]
MLKSDAIAQWKVHSDYHVRAIFETVILRSKGSLVVNELEELEFSGRLLVCFYAYVP